MMRRPRCWRLDARITYILIEGVTVLLAVSIFVAFMVKRWDLTWGWRFTLPLLVAAFAIVVQRRFDRQCKRRWGLFVMFSLGWVGAASTLAIHSDRPTILRAEHVPPDLLDIAVALSLIPLLAFAAEAVFEITRPWLGWKRYPNPFLEAITLVPLAVILYWIGIESLEPPTISGQLLLGVFALAVALLGFWFLPLRWMPRSLLLFLWLVGFGNLHFEGWIGLLILVGIFGMLLGTFQERHGPIYEIWARRKGLPIPAES